MHFFSINQKGLAPIILIIGGVLILALGTALFFVVNGKNILPGDLPGQPGITPIGSASATKKPASSVQGPTSPAPTLSARPPGEARKYLLSSTGIQAVPGKEPFYQYNVSLNDLAKDSDVLTIFVEHYGIPWNEFASSDQPPADHPWRKIMEKMASDAKSSGKPVFAQLPFTRKKLAGQALNNGGNLKVEDFTSSNDCYDFTQVATPGTDAFNKGIAYLNYVKWMVKTFQPKYLNLAIELNLYYQECGNSGGKWDRVVDIEKSVYDAAKSVKFDIVVFPSIQIDSLYNDSLNGFDQGRYNAIKDLKRDRFAISTYPFNNMNGSKRAQPSDLPADYLIRAANKAGEKVIIAETGWNSDDLKVGSPGSCSTLIPSNEDLEAQYFNYVVKSAQTNNIELINWWSNRDLLPQNVMTACYDGQCGNDSWCSADKVFKDLNLDALFKDFGTMGIRRYDGTPKTIMYSLWQQARK